ncbi:MAG: glycosyltransferase family 4 protein [Sandaracinus sp.]|nr:glycosyltransferase family 4 protein [Myxococcales bacterium]MCB9601385.1 glycosyltransferase family 4 protein [Sandaracinus sp.]MCB9620912.1 glycosyltransferase family 4 protein [Sandaracinus sp.]MCB9621966.1 glycosyltransferase family 4 protein [Sandaracinus sp.]
MRIAVLSTGHPRFEGDVAGCFVEGFADVLRDRGHDVHVFAPTPRENVGGSTRWVTYAPRTWRRTFYGAGVPENVRDPRAWPGLVTYPAALRVAARGGWDAVVAHFGIPCGFVATRLQSPRVLTVWHSADVALASRLPRAWLRPLLATGTHWLVREEHRARLRPARAFVRPMGVHAPNATPAMEARERLGLDGRPVVLFLGRLVRIKGVDTLVEALGHRRDLQLVIAGEGPERARLEAAAPAARFLGHVAGRRKDDALAAADVVALPSRLGRSGRSEGAPLVATEAALAGKARVATHSVGLPEDEAWNVEGTPASIASAVDAVLASPQDERVRVAHERAKSLTWSALAPTVDALVRDAWR